jgi:hypothetical protein
MKYAPGSFSKNFGWHGTGLRKLHSAIRAGFGRQLLPVRRQDWRDRSGIADKNIDLVPINFFLHNHGGTLSIDELVFDAIRKPHSVEFDRLALFAFHLNRVGSGPRVVERPAMWANKFVRERLWNDGAWVAAELNDDRLDPFIDDHLDALDDVRVKCRNNYRHMFELCEYLPSRLSLINTGAESWIASALFLVWDRHLLDGGSAAKADLLALLEREEVFKLLGTTQDSASAQAGALVGTYLTAGNMGRFSLPSTVQGSVTSRSSSATASTQTEIPEESTGQWIDQDESDSAVERRTIESQAQLRDRRKAAALKRHYANTCTFCATRLQIASDKFYSEAAHVKALGKPHNGPDRIKNMLVLCPHHHLQFDRGVLRLKQTANGFVIQSRIKGDALHGKQIVLKHDLDPDMVTYHWNWHSRTWR